MQDILLVEDDEDARVFYAHQLKSGKISYRVHEASTEKDCLEMLSKMDFYCVVLDYHLKETNASGLVEKIKANKLDGSPIIILTGREDEELGLKLVQSGAQDYLVKSEINGRLLSRAIEYAVERHQLTRELEKSHEKEHYLAYHDSLTALPNRQSFFRQLEHSIAQIKRNNQKCAVLFVDLDGFKKINDTMGHSAGDELLQKVARRLENCVRGSDTVARLGGDEFTVVLTNISEAQDVAKVAKKILDTVSFSHHKGRLEFPVTASVGISMFPMDGYDAKTLVKNADIAMYRAKHQGKNSYQFYDRHMEAVAFERLALEMSLRQALQKKEFQLYYLPQFSGDDLMLSGFEVLLRWNHPELGILSPEKFLEVAESTGLIVPLGYWMMGEASREYRKWLERGFPKIQMNINLSSRQLRDKNFEDTLIECLGQGGIPPGLIGLEIPEEVIRAEILNIETILEPLNRRGIKVYVDDFGTGFSSVNHLKKLPINGLKIDGSFLNGVPGNSGNEGILSAIIAMASVLKLEVIAEGVEKGEQAEVLRRLGCRHLQGFYLGGPVGADNFFPQWISKKADGTTG